MTLPSDIKDREYRKFTEADTGEPAVRISQINALVTEAYDYIALTQASLTDTWVFKTGGSGGTTVATVVVTFTSSAKTIISTVVKT